jgi:hypothetical protein
MKLFVAILLLALTVGVDAAAAPQVQAIRPFEATAVPHRRVAELPPAGRVGNRDLLHWVVRDRFGHAFGIATLDCNWYRSHERMCVGVFRLARGTFVVAGSGQNRAFGEFLVLTGTGDYSSPKGPLRFSATRRGKLTLRGSF